MKPEIVEAVQIKHANRKIIEDELGLTIIDEHSFEEPDPKLFAGVNLPGFMGHYRASEPDWIIKKADGRLISVSDDEFNKDYQAI